MTTKETPPSDDVSELSPKYVDLDAEVQVKSGVNAGNDLPAIKAFLQHPARALSARELAILMETGEKKAEDALDVLVKEGVVVQTNELDGDQFRFRLI